jgi:hypothetical protein
MSGRGWMNEQELIAFFRNQMEMILKTIRTIWDSQVKMGEEIINRQDVINKEVSKRLNEIFDVHGDIMKGFNDIIKGIRDISIRVTAIETGADLAKVRDRAEKAEAA